MTKIIIPMALIALTSGRYCLSAAPEIPCDLPQSNQTENLETIEPYLLHSAVKKQNIELVEKLIADGTTINLLDTDGLTPLNYAVRTGNKNLIDILRDNGALLAGEKVVRRKR